MIRSLRSSTDLPLIFFGDFNEILLPSKKEEGSQRRESQMGAFRDAVDNYGLHDLGLQDNKFTWQRGGIKERLDRFLADSSWMQLFPSV